MEDLTTLYCVVDDFWKMVKQEGEKHLSVSDKPKHGPDPDLSIPEMMTIMILSGQSKCRPLLNLWEPYRVTHGRGWPCVTAPYAGLNQVRFYGCFLSPVGHPRSRETA